MSEDRVLDALSKIPSLFLWMPVYRDVIRSVVNGFEYPGKAGFSKIHIELIKQLLLVPEREKIFHPRGIALRDVEFYGDKSNFDFSSLRFRFPLSLKSCDLKGKLVLRSTRGGSLDLTGSTLVGLDLAEARFSGSVILDETFLMRPQVDGEKPEAAVHADGLVTKQKFSFKRCVAIGGIDLTRATIGGNVNGEGACLINPHYAEYIFPSYRECKCARGTFSGLAMREWCDHDVSCIGRLPYPLHSDGDGASVKALRLKQLPPYDPNIKTFNVLRLHNAHVHGSVLLQAEKEKPRRFLAFGEVSLNSARVDGGIFCRGALFFQHDGVALSLDGLVTRLSIYLEERAETGLPLWVNGTISMQGVEVGHRFVYNAGRHFKACTNAKAKNANPLHDRQKYAFFAARAHISGDLFFNWQFDNQRTDGLVLLDNAQIGGQLSLAIAPNRSAESPPELSLAFVQVASTLKLSIRPSGSTQAVSQWYRVDLRSARIGSIDLSACSHGEIRWDLDGMLYRNVENVEKVSLAFNGSQDKSETSWERVWTDDILGGSRVRDEKWSVALQPFEIFATVLRESGREDTARRVGVAKEDIITKNIWINLQLEWPTRSVYGAWRESINFFSHYGYNPARAFISFVILVVVGSLFFSLGVGLPFADGFSGCLGTTWEKSLNKQEDTKEIHGVFPTKVFVYTGVQHGEIDPKKYLGKQIPSNYPGYCPLIYSLELATPLANLGQGSHWEVEGGHLIDVYRWAHVLLGWFLCLLIVLSPTELLRKD
ncbi:hypothetical protein [Candidatus Accumulibacter sp. ACC003]|uniref:hypothetical protein n=1 Tax=Candidatus Accumulibacter sp. ACC003 TaxID=2823334 RepID=UPI0025C32B67|nr:hypothetical protein [Candidatus Accumulibacter sp. ACC003]